MKYLKHILGFTLISFGIVGIIRAQLGASPMDAFNVFLHMLLQNHGINVTLGTVVFVIGALATLLTYILTKDKKLIFSFIFLMLLSLFVDGWNYLFGLIPEEILSHLAYRIPSAIIVFFIMCFGVALTLTTGLPTLPYERLLLHIDKNINNISISKIFIDGTFFIAAIVLGLILGVDVLFQQVHIMTFVIAFFTGVVVKRFVNILKKGVVVHEIKQND